MAEDHGFEISNEELQLMLEAGTAYYEQGQLTKAREVFEGVAAIAPTLAMPFASLAAIDHLEGNDDAAVERYEKALDLDPDDKYANCNLGEILLARCHNERALELLKRAAEVDAEGHIRDRAISVLLTNGGVYYDRTDYETAETIFRSATTICPAEAAGHVRLGAALQAQDRVEEALAEYLEALSLDDSEKYAHLYAAEILGQQGKKKEARSHLDRARALDTAGDLAEQFERVSGA